MENEHSSEELASLAARILIMKERDLWAYGGKGPVLMLDAAACHRLLADAHRLAGSVLTQARDRE